MTSVEQDYISANRLVYDSLASEYRKRAAVDRLKDIPLLAPFVSYLKETFGTNCRVLDIGPGNGVNLEMLHEAGFQVAGVDISPAMLNVAKEICPAAELYLGDFLVFPFGEESFEGVFAKASLHLIPKTHAIRAFRKIYNILSHGGLFYVTTTAELDSDEGYSSKTDYPGEPIRFRKHWTPSELAAAVVDAGFQVYKDDFDFEVDWNKRWYNIWAIKNGIDSGG